MEEEIKDKVLEQSQEAETAETNPEDTVQAKDGNGAPITEKLPKEIFYERISALRPDANYTDNEDEYYNQAGSVLDELEQGNKRYKDFSDKLMRRFQEDPDEAQAILDYVDGMPLIAAIRKNKGDEAMSMKEGDDGWEDFQKAGADRKKRFEEQQALVDEIMKNSKESEEVISKFIDDSGLDDEQKNQIIEQIQKDLEDLSRGRITPDILNRYMLAKNHDADVDGARQQGEVDGRNKAIEAGRKRMQGSGLPNGGAGGDVSEEVETTDNPTADWLGKRNWRK